MTEIVALKEYLYSDKRSFMIAFNNNEEFVNKYLLGLINTLQASPELMSCTKESIRDAAITSATLDVPLDARKYAYLVPFGKKAQFQLSYKGYVHIAKRDPDVDNIQSVLVYKKDEFSFDVGQNSIKHIPALDDNGYGVDASVVFVYAVARFKEGTGRAPIFEVMTKAQVDKIKATAKQSYIWEKHYGEMARKTVIKRLCKHAQLGDVARYEQIDNAIEENKIINVTPAGELVVDNKDFTLKNEILEAVNQCFSMEQLNAVQAKYQDDIQELYLYNTGYTKEITKAMGVKEDAFVKENIIEYLSACEDSDGLDKVYKAHEVRINRFAARDRNNILSVYTDMKQQLLDRNVP